MFMLALCGWVLYELGIIGTDQNATKLSTFSMEIVSKKLGGNGIICHAKFDPIIPWFPPPDTP
jgi:hypothetical protein